MAINSQRLRVRISVHPQLAVTQVRRSPRVMLDGCLNNSRDPAMPNTCRNQRRGLSAGSVFAVQQPTECGQLSSLQDGCSALSLHMYCRARQSDRSGIPGCTLARPPPLRRPPTSTSAAETRVHELSSSRPKARPLNVLGSDATLISVPRDSGQPQGRASVRRLVAVAATTCSRHTDPAGWEHQ